MTASKTIGFLVNPIAGMGGSVGLKGTDTEDILRKATLLGAREVSKEKARKVILSLKSRIGRTRGMKRFGSDGGSNLMIFTCAGSMGENILKELNFSNYSIVSYPAREGCTNREDTKNACMGFLNKNVDLVLFCGGDGTARDVLEIVRKKIPVLGIPSGVKMYSSVFGINPDVTAKIAERFLEGKAEVREGKVMDIDEEKFRENKLSSKLFGYVNVPYEDHYKDLVQNSKLSFSSLRDEEQKERIAKFVIESMDEKTVFVMCPGSTVKKIADTFGLRTTLLGVDVIKNKKLIAKDVNEKEILKILTEERSKDFSEAKILVSPLGAQGFIFGRGNQQISKDVILKVGIRNIIILATPLKLSQTPNFYVDTGDKSLDKRLSGEKRVITGYRTGARKEIKDYTDF